MLPIQQINNLSTENPVLTEAELLSSEITLTSES
jgi:hypothetical protein